MGRGHALPARSRPTGGRLADGCARLSAGTRPQSRWHTPAGRTSGCWIDAALEQRVERRCGGVGDHHDAVETGRVEQPRQRRPTARHRHLATRLPDLANPTDERAQPGRVHERHLGQVDEQTGGTGLGGEGLPERRHRVGIEFSDGPDHDVGVVLGGVDVEHDGSFATRPSLRLRCGVGYDAADNGSGPVPTRPGERYLPSTALR